ncbi:hypothetical protein QBC46DRAFT_438723 [Diplogelasinospora grovesii]|uniref:Uncharacterized protein n=1 Tax=Diplogelasinospora grovesii TaxID=303347 RepID=A0AAN6S2U0_9PEZI|nr:hypothetical protein QBC46DRAFT_438723 [Diplogelasinospora grovesii]
MAKGNRKPTIRVLIVGAAGVGKNCLESRFTTCTYPPLYDPSLTLSSRRFLTLSPYQPPEEKEPVTRPLNTSHGLESLPLVGSSLEAAQTTQHEERPRSDGGVSSTFSNPTASTPQTPRTDNTNNTSPPSSNDNDLLPSPTRPPPAPPPAETRCKECVREATYMVELTNYPSLQLPKVRQQLYARGEYDAVLLVYDVGNRESFDAIMDLHSEIPLRKFKSRKKDSSGVRRKRSSIFGNATNNDTTTTGDGEGGGGETVVALIGNKSDFDTYYLPLSPFHLDKEAAKLQEVEVEERSLVHPLWRESRVYEDDTTPLPMSSSPTKSSRSVPLQRRRRTPPHMTDNNGARRSVIMSETGGQQNRSSVLFSTNRRESIKTVPEGRTRMDRDMERNIRTDRPLRRESTSSAEAIERWMIQTNNPLTPPNDHHRHNDNQQQVGLVGGVSEDEEDVVTRVETNTNTNITTTAASPKRQVSRLEGEMLARQLLLSVPFFETSAKTGENVEQVFEAIVREVLSQMGRSPPEPEQKKHERHAETEETKTGNKERRGCAKNTKESHEVEGTKTKDTVHKKEASNSKPQQKDGNKGSKNDKGGKRGKKHDKTISEEETDNNRKGLARKERRKKLGKEDKRTRNTAGTPVQEQQQRDELLQITAVSTDIGKADDESSRNSKNLLAEEAILEEEEEAETSTQMDVGPSPQHYRRESFLGRFKRAFGSKKSSPIVPHVAA